MKIKLTIIFLLLILLPIIFLLIFGSKSFKQGELNLKTEIYEYQKENSLKTKQVVQNRINEIQVVLQNLFQFNFSNNKEPILTETLIQKKITQINSPYLLQTYWMNKEGILKYPTLHSSNNRSEADFLIKTMNLWQNNNFVDQTKNVKPSEYEINQWGNTQQIAQTMQTSTATLNFDGFVSWYGGKGLMIIYWQQLENGDFIGAELNLSYVKAKIITGLPSQLNESITYQLIDEKQNLIHEWGVVKIDKDSKELIKEYFAFPFSSWTLLTFGEAPKGLQLLNSNYKTTLITNILIICLVLFLCGSLAYFLMIKEMKDLQKKMNFITEVSHELKTPLTNIRLYAELLERKVFSDDEKSKSYIQILLQETQRLSRMIHNVLTYRKLNSKSNNINTNTFSLNELAEKCLQSFLPILESKGFIIEKKFELNKNVVCDMDSFEQILSNLINNAEKYANEGKYLCIRTFEENSFAVLECIDHGRPLTKALAEKIFLPFFRAHKDLSHGAGGTGVGLTISRELAILNGGKLYCIPFASGNIFRLQLPLQKGGI